MRAALALILAFMAAEVTAGILASSLALLSDAAHMLTDAAALGLSLAATVR
jgi:cobalt-zinc-cadmium efflux system protein